VWGAVIAAALRFSMWLSASHAHACTRTNDTSYLPEPSVTNVRHMLESGSEAHRNRKGPYAIVRPSLLQNSEVLQLPALARVSANFPVAKYRRGMLAFCTMICDRLTLAKPRDGVKISTVHKAYGPFLVRYCSDPLSDYLWSAKTASRLWTPSFPPASIGGDAHLFCRRMPWR
jgi:hypothetical protein